MREIKFRGKVKAGEISGKKDDVLNMIVWIALDYDGCGDNAECLQKLVDELRELACYGRNLDE